MSTTVLFKGYLNKLGEVNKQWKKRYFELVVPQKGGARLVYYRQPGESPSGSVNVENAFTQVSSDPLLPHGFEVVTPNRTYILTASSQEKMEQWIAELTKVSAVSMENELFGQLENVISDAETRKLEALNGSQSKDEHAADANDADS